ncbi:MAG: alpha/beta hydrolase [Bacteroidia bacterium]|nr:alpha/beta hydrolase [Bacteroidia bacterium]
MLIHGYMVDSGMFSPVEGALAQHYRLIIPDLRGYGSAWNWPGPYTLHQRAMDVLRLAEELAKNECIWILGYSMGGLITQIALQECPERIAGAILACTFAYKPQTTLEQWQGRLLPRILRIFPPTSIANLLYPQAFGSEEFPPEVIEWYKKALQRTRMEVLLADAEELFRVDMRGYLSKIRHPILVIGGTADLMVPPHHSRQLAENIRGAQLILYPNAGHALIFTHRRPFVRDIHRFILSVSHKHLKPSLHSYPSQSPQSQPQ